MKRLFTAALSAIMLIGCGSRSENSSAPIVETEQSVTEIENTNISSAAPKSSAASRIIYREKLYNIDSYTKSDLIIQSDGRVWCGFYMHNEGTIDKFNRLWTTEKDFETPYRLDDDVWLDSVLSETKDDDFMLFGDIFELDRLSDEQLDKISSLIEDTDPFSASNVFKAPEDSADPDVIETEYSFIDLIIGDKVCRAYEYTQLYSSMVQDENASEVIDLIHSYSFYDDWREKCSENITPYKKAE